MSRFFIGVLLITVLMTSGTGASVFTKKNISHSSPADSLFPATSNQTIDPDDEDTIRLFSDHIGYEQSNRIVVASSNVRLEYKDIQISAEKLTMDVDNNYVWGTGKVVIKRGDDEFESNGIMLDLNNETVTLNKINICIVPPKEQNTQPGPNDKLFVRAEVLTDTPTYKYGYNGLISACSYPPKKQHNYVWAKSFKYYPDKRLTMYNVVFYNKLLFVPMYFWLPYYSYALGPKKIVWNFPTMGKKDETGWGWFVQNTIDYKHENGKDSSILVDWYETKDGRQGNWGYGIRHNYQLKNNQGRLYFYNYDFLEKTSSTTLKKSNTIKDWNNIYTLNEKWTLSHYISDVNVDRKINSTGKDIHFSKGAALHYNDFGDKFDTNFDELNNSISHVKSTRYGFQRTVNNQSLYQYNFSETDFISSFRRDLSSSGEYTAYLPHDASIKSEFNYTAFEGNTRDNLPSDTSLITKFTLSKKVSDKLDVSLMIDEQTDLDSSRVTSDSNGANNYLHKLPEITFSFKNLSYKKLQFTQKTIIANYREVHFDNTSQKTRDFPDSLSSIEPNTYIFNQKISTTIDKLPLKSTWTTSTGYDQYLFKTPSKGLFEGDALYLYSFETGLSNDILGFIRTRSKYESRYAPKENNSPFFEFQRNISQENQFSESVTLYFEREKLRFFPYYFGFTWDNSANYSWIKEEQKWGIYNTRTTFKLTKMFTISADTGKKLNFDKAQSSSRFTPFHITMDLVPTENFKFHYDLSLDLNKWIDHEITDVKNSNFTIGFTLGKTPEYEWQLQTGFVYNKKDSSEENLIVNRYELQTLNLVKKEHERDLIIGYNKLNDELRILYRFNVFPNDPLELVKRNNFWSLEGRFKQNSEERFNGGS